MSIDVIFGCLDGQASKEVPIHSLCWMGVVHMERFRPPVTTAVHTQAPKAASEEQGPLPQFWC
jgi:hypothetical protein